MPQQEGQSGAAMTSSIKELLPQYQDLLNPKGDLKQTTEDMATTCRPAARPLPQNFSNWTWRSWPLPKKNSLPWTGRE
jgi:hypothetical protein